MPYFYNPQTSQSVWDKPDELTPEQVRALPGAAKYMTGANAAPAPAAAAGGKPGEVRASHILCKHAGSRRPSSWREVSDPSTISSPYGRDDCGASAGDCGSK